MKELYNELRGIREDLSQLREILIKTRNKVISLNRENDSLRSFVGELLDAASRECATCNYDCGPKRENCIYTQAAKFLEQKEAKR